MYEDSVAHRFTFFLVLITGHLASVSIIGTAHNPLWFALANLAGTAVLTTLGYWAQIYAGKHVSFLHAVVPVAGRVQVSET